MVAVVALWLGQSPPMGVRLTMSSSAPPQSCRIEPVRVATDIVDDAKRIIAAKNGRVEGLWGHCRCSKIMSPPNCNETLSPYEDGDDESERVPTGESD